MAKKAASPAQLAARKNFTAMVKNKKTKVGKAAAKKGTGKKKKLNPGLAAFLAKKAAAKKGTGKKKKLNPGLAAFLAKKKKGK